MIQIYPTIDFHTQSPYGGVLLPKKILWQGVHTCVEAECSSTERIMIADLPVGHAVMNPCQVNLTSGEVFCNANVKKWLGIPLLHSLQNPHNVEIELTVEKFHSADSVVIVNCIDHLYGHALLKLLNVERHLAQSSSLGVVVVVQDFLRWLVPEGVAEVWTVKLPLNKAKNFYPTLNDKIQNECKRFTSIFLSKAFSHPSIKNITRFSRVEKHNVQQQEYRITFIWRNDRQWIASSYVLVLLKKIGAEFLLNKIQNKKIIKLFTKLRKTIPHAKFTVAGFGTITTFPSWIEDKRVALFSEETERELCKIYSQSRVVIGVHGSNMLLPSAHAGMTVDLMPKDRWGNFAQDIVFQEENYRLSSFRYRFFPISTSLTILSHSIATQIFEYNYFKEQMSV